MLSETFYYILMLMFLSTMGEISQRDLLQLDAQTE